MALLKCRECGADVSDRAKSCPSCGAPVGGGGWKILFWVAVLCSIAAMSAYLLQDKPVKITKDELAKAKSQLAKDLGLKWSFSESVDEMSGDKSYSTSSPLAYPGRVLSFPYRDLYSYISISCDKNGVSAMVYFSSSLSLVNAEFKRGAFRVESRTKWGDELNTTKFKFFSGGSALYPTHEKLFASQLVKATDLKIETHWKTAGTVVWDYSLNGASENIKRLSKTCKGLK